MDTATKTTSAQEEIALLAGTLTGTVDGTMNDITAVATSGGNTYADSAINAKITLINAQLKELQTKLNEVVQKLANMGEIQIP